MKPVESPMKIEEVKSSGVSVKSSIQEVPKPIVEQKKPAVAVNTEEENETRRKHEQGKFDDLSVKVDDLKELAAAQYKKGMYEEAVKLYEQAANLAES